MLIVMCYFQKFLFWIKADLALFSQSSRTSPAQIFWQTSDLWCFHNRIRGVTERAKKLLKNTSWQKITLIVLEKSNMIWTCLSLGLEVGMF